MLCPGTGRKKGGDFPRHHQPLIFARASARLRISARASRTTSRRTPRSNHRRDGSSGIRSTSQASPLDRICSIQSLTRYISTAEKRAPRFRMASSTTGRFSSSSSSQQGDRFPSQPDESGASGGSATSDRLWSAPPGYAAHLLPPGN